MPSTIAVTTALKSACIELLTELGNKAEAHALEVEYHVVSAWASSLLRNPTRLSAAAVAAQHEFSADEINAYWLSALNDLIQFGGEDAHSFAVTLCRFYLFNLSQVEESLWQQYNDLRQNVVLEAGPRRLPDSWGEWDGPMRAFMQLFAQHLRREDTTFGLLFGAPTVRELAEVRPPPMLPGRVGVALPIPPVAVDDTAALTTYLEWCLEQYGRLEPGGVQSGERSGLRLDDVFVPRRLLRLDDWEVVRGYVRYQMLAQRQGSDGGPFRGRAAARSGAGESSPPGPVTQTLDDAVRLLVLAGPGEGKTTLLRHLALQHASLILTEQAELPFGQRSRSVPLSALPQRVPLYLHVADYADHTNLMEESLLDYLLGSLAEDHLRDPSVPGMLRRILEAGQAVILLDGLDTVRGDHNRRVVAARISQLAAEWCAGPEGNRVLVVSRPSGARMAPLSADFEMYRLAPLSREETGECLMRWALASERARRPMLVDDELHRQAERAAIGILREISRDEWLRSMAANPLLLRIMAERHHEGVYFSPRRVGLLRAAAEARIRDWRLARGPTRTPQVQETEVTELLSDLAYWLHDRSSSGVASEREVAARLSGVWLHRHPQASEEAAREAIADFLAKVRRHGGLLAEVRPRHYGFVHLSMQEYFAARYLVSRYRLAPERIRQHLHAPRWEEVVRLAVSFVALDSPPDASDLLESSILARSNGVGGQTYPPSPFENVLKRDLFFGGSLLGDGIEASPELTRDIVQQLVDLWLLGERDSAGRFYAIFDRVRQLLSALDGTAAGQMALYYALTHVEDERPPVRAFLADALTFWPSQATLALQTLVSLGRDEAAMVRRSVAEALGRVGSLTPDAHVLLLSMVSDSDNNVRDVARRVLARAGPVPDSAMRVWVRLLHDDDPGRRQLGAKVLQRIGTLPPLVVGELLALLSDEDPRVRRTVADTLATIDVLPEDALVSICRTINDAQPNVRVAAIEALARSVALPDEVLEQVIHWSREPDPQVRLAATRVLDACTNLSEPVIDALMTRTGDDVLSVRQLAIEALGRKGAGNPRIGHLLLHFATETSPGIKISAANAFGYLGELSEEGQGYLVDLLEDFHSGVRQAAMKAAARLGHPYARVVECLASMAASENPDEVIQAARALAAIDGLPAPTLAALVRLLPDHAGELAEPVAACLHRHSPLTAEVAHPLMDLALAAPSNVRHLAIGVLGQSLHAVPRVLELLLQLAADPDVQVRAAALDSLSRARDLSDHALDMLFGMLDGEPLPVRRAAAVTLARLSRTLPHLGWDARRMEFLTDRVYGLLGELPPRAAWEPDVGGQDAVFEALSWLALRYRPEL